MMRPHWSLARPTPQKFNNLRTNHPAKVTGGNVQYEGSMTIDEDFMDKVGLLPFEKILCSNMDNSLMLMTALNPHIGYEKAAQISLKAATKT